MNDAIRCFFSLEGDRWLLYTLQKAQYKADLNTFSLFMDEEKDLTLVSAAFSPVHSTASISLIIC